MIRLAIEASKKEEEKRLTNLQLTNQLSEISAKSSELDAMTQRLAEMEAEENEMKL